MVGMVGAAPTTSWPQTMPSAVELHSESQCFPGKLHAVISDSG
jgi:hypothetical protein